jgi:hypothetical protein
VRYWSGDNSGGALDAFVDSINRRRDGAEVDEDGGSVERWRILLFDEVMAFQILLSSTEIKAFHKSLSYALLTGRAFRHVVVAGIQKAMMSAFGSEGGRSQFGNTILIGSLANDREQVAMLLPGKKDEIADTKNRRGQFWFVDEPGVLRRGQLPFISDIPTLYPRIIEGCSC